MEEGTVEKTVSILIVSVENVSKSVADVLKLSSSLHEQNAIAALARNIMYANIDFILLVITPTSSFYCKRVP